MLKRISYVNKKRKGVIKMSKNKKIELCSICKNVIIEKGYDPKPLRTHGLCCEICYNNIQRGARKEELEKKFVCSICGKTYYGFGNNPEPLLDDYDYRCCDSCNENFVLPYRRHYVEIQRRGISRETFFQHVKEGRVEKPTSYVNFFSDNPIPVPPLPREI
ncbi:MAG: hypothetical protein ACLFUW_10000 [Bacteroidales bacterium]